MLRAAVELEEVRQIGVLWMGLAEVVPVLAARGPLRQGEGGVLAVSLATDPAIAVRLETWAARCES